MSAPIVYVIGDDPNGYGGAEEVSQQQATAYAEALAAGMKKQFPDVDVRVGAAGPLSADPAELKLYAWVQRNWRRVRAEVNTARGWSEQEGGTLRMSEQRCF